MATSFGFDDFSTFSTIQLEVLRMEPDLSGHELFMVAHWVLQHLMAQGELF